MPSLGTHIHYDEEIELKTDTTLTPNSTIPLICIYMTDIHVTKNAECVLGYQCGVCECNLDVSMKQTRQYIRV